MLVLALLLFAQGGCLVVTQAAPSPQQRRSVCSLVLFVTQQPYRRPFEALDERLMHRLHASKPKQSWCPALRSVPDICGCTFRSSTSPQADNGPGHVGLMGSANKGANFGPSREETSKQTLENHSLIMSPHQRP